MYQIGSRAGAYCRISGMVFDADAIDTGHSVHGLSLGFNMNLAGFHGELCEVKIKALEPLQPGLPEPKPYSGSCFCFFDRQTNRGFSLGRTRELMAFAGWRVRVCIGKIAVEQLDHRIVQSMLRQPITD